MDVNWTTSTSTVPWDQPLPPPPPSLETSAVCRQQEIYYDGIATTTTDLPYVDSLHQLNKIVERILPETAAATCFVPASDVKRQRSFYSDDSASRKLDVAPSGATYCRQNSSRKTTPALPGASGGLSRAGREPECSLQPGSTTLKREVVNNDVYKSYDSNSAYETFSNDDKYPRPQTTITTTTATPTTPRHNVSPSRGRMLLPASLSYEGGVHRLNHRTRSLDTLSSEMFTCPTSSSSSSASSTSQDNVSCRSDNVSTSHRPRSCSARDGDTDRENSLLLRVDKRHSSADDLNSIMTARHRHHDDGLRNSTSTPVDSNDPRSNLTPTSYTHRQQPATTRITANDNSQSKCYSCPHCHYGAPKKGQVRKHMSVHGIFLCAHCEFMCDQPELLDEHRRRQHPGLCGRRLCKKCRVLFPSTELDSHERQCSGEKQRWECPECGKQFKFLSVMKAHALKWHPPDDELPSTTTLVTASSGSAACSEDNDETECSDVNEDILTPRHSLSPSLPPPHSISTPPIICKPASSLPPSLPLPPPPPPPAVVYQCEECGKSFKTKWTLSNHSIQAHGATTPFCCDLEGCNGTPFRSDKELNSHRETVHLLGPRKYNCTHPGCSMQFAKYGHFKRHQSTHIGVTSSMVSDSSGASTSMPATLELKYRCDWPSCSKAFPDPDILQTHYRRHTDEKPFHCRHCSASYRQKSGLKYHLDKVHNEHGNGHGVAGTRKRKLQSPEVDQSEVDSSSHSNMAAPLSDGPAPLEYSRGPLTECHQGDRLLAECHITGGTGVGDTIRQKIRDSVNRSKATVMANTVGSRDDDLKQDWKVESSTTLDMGVIDDPRWPLDSVMGDDDLDSIGIDDEWLLDGGCTDSNQLKLRFSRTTSSSMMSLSQSLRPPSVQAGSGLPADQMGSGFPADQTGSTSDTEPLDEDLQEELRKLTDVINGANLSPSLAPGPDVIQQLPSPLEPQADDDDNDSDDEDEGEGINDCVGHYQHPQNAASRDVTSATSIYHPTTFQQTSGYDVSTSGWTGPSCNDNGPTYWPAMDRATDSVSSLSGHSSVTSNNPTVAGGGVCTPPDYTGALPLPCPQSQWHGNECSAPTMWGEKSYEWQEMMLSNQHVNSCNSERFNDSRVMMGFVDGMPGGQDVVNSRFQQYGGTTLLDSSGSGSSRYITPNGSTGPIYNPYLPQPQLDDQFYRPSQHYPSPLSDTTTGALPPGVYGGHPWNGYDVGDQLTHHNRMRAFYQQQQANMTATPMAGGSLYNMVPRYYPY